MPFLDRSLLVHAYRRWEADRASSLAAAIAYYATFSFAPLLVVALALVGLVYDRGAAQSEILNAVRVFLGDQGAAFVGDTLSAVGDTGIGALAVGGLLTLLGSVTLFKHLQEAANIIWRVHPHGRGWKAVVLRRLSLFTFVGLTALVTMASTLAGALVTFAGDLAVRTVGAPPSFLHLANAALTIFMTALAVGVLFKTLPDAPVAWKDVWPATVLTTILLGIGRYGIGLYLGLAGATNAYGAAGSFVAFLVWVYYTAQIFLYGVELTKASHDRQANPSEDERAAPRARSRRTRQDIRRTS